MVYIVATIVVIAALAFFLFAPERCKNCRSKLEKVRYRWLINGKEADVCQGCHQGFQRARPAHVRPIRQQEEQA